MLRHSIPVNRALYALVCALSGIAVASCVGCSKQVPAPTAFKNWTPKESYFHIQYPENWEADGGGKQGLQWAKFTKGSCKISARTDVSSSLVGDIVASGNQMATGGEPMDPEIAEKLAPVAQVHEMNGKLPPDGFSGYKEEAMQVFKSPLGDGRKSVFTASVGLGSKVRGYRATVLAHDRGITVICSAPAKNWPDLQPAYDKILESLSPGDL